MDTIPKISAQPDVAAALAGFHTDLEEILALVARIQQVPAPTFAEAKRAKLVEREMSALGLADVSRDALQNVYGRLPGTSPAAGRPVIVSAHLDTVFPVETDLTLSRTDHYLCGPGVGDNSTGVAGILTVAHSILHRKLDHCSDIWIVANVGEEGLGDLRGMRAVVDRFGGEARYVVVEGGLFGQLSYQAIGVKRYRVDVTAPGGHSWGNFGAASAIHTLAHVATDIDGLSVPASPKTTYNVGLIEGGTSINTIAQQASMWLDLRSEDPATLDDMVGHVSGILDRHSRQHASRGTDVQIAMTQVGNRPAGHAKRNSPLVSWARAALRQVGHPDVRTIASSTDANVPLSHGYDAICLGLTESANSHRLDEYIDIDHLPAGLGQLLLVALAAANAFEE
jgi:acetylornithine deacetylase/succinyl-diaminopimelate desuccinylase-like protein